MSIGPAYPTLRDAGNLLLVINDSPNDILPFTEYTENGERRVVPEIIPAVVPNADFVHCGLFIYSKYQIYNVAVGTYGSAFGVSYSMAGGHFSIGMDFPNSLMGGNNSIEVYNQPAPRHAREMALSLGTNTGGAISVTLMLRLLATGGMRIWVERSSCRVDILVDMTDLRSMF